MVRELFDVAGPPSSQPQSERVVWDDNEKRAVRTLVKHTEWFVDVYRGALLADAGALHHLKTHVAVMEQKFKGVYAACVRDILRQEPGFHQALAPEASSSLISCA